jgi:hypothetical protein
MCFFLKMGPVKMSFVKQNEWAGPRRRRPARSAASGRLVARRRWALAAIGLFLAVRVLPGGEVPSGASGAVEADPARGEVRIPCRFVNPTQKLEVLACHESGPTHETVVAFEAGGEEIYRALRDVGFRGPEFWNIASPRDVDLVGGDRALVWLRWEWKGEVHEVPAEELLIEEGTGIPLFVRGFTFTAKPVPLGDPPRPGIPRTVELTIGGTSRQSATFSMLQHPDDLPEMINWEPAPEVNPHAVDLRGVVEERTSCRLIIRRLKGEAELLDQVTARESSPDRREARRLQVRFAAGIDERKKRFEGLVGEVRALLEQNESRTLSDEEGKSFAARVQSLIDRATALAAEVRELYLRMWGEEEQVRFREIERATVDPDLRAWAAMAYRSGFRFELAIAGKNRQVAAIKAEGAAAKEKGDLLARALEKEIEALSMERERRWARFKLEHEVRPRLKKLDPQEEEYVIRLFRESELRIQGDMRALRSRAEAARVAADELRAESEGTLPGKSAELARRREQAEALRALAEAEVRNVELLEKLRWAENPRDPLEKGAEDEKKNLSGEREQLLVKLKKLGDRLAAVSGRPPGTGEEPPDDGKGNPLFPEELQD